MVTTSLQAAIAVTALAIILGRSVDIPQATPLGTPEPELRQTTAPAVVETPQPPVASSTARRLTVLNHAPSYALTAEQAEQVARDNDVITANTGQIEAHLPRMRKINPDLKALVYVNGAYAYAHEGDAFPRRWYARDASGRRVRQRHWGNFLMNPTKAWRLEVARRCQTSIVNDGYDGCAVDELGPEGVSLSHVTGIPVHRLTGEPWTRAEWIEAMRATADRVKTELGDRVVYINGLVHGAYYAADNEPTSRLVNKVDGAMAEVWLRCRDCPLESKRTESFWNREVRLIVDMESRGKAALVAVETCPNGTAAQKDALYKYALATFLMGAEGRSLFHFNRDCDWESKVAPHRWGPLERSLGPPVQPYGKDVGGTYRRPFAGGLVIANPSDETLTTTLVTPMRSIDGSEVGTLVLPPGSGEVLLFMHSAELDSHS